MSPSSDPDAPGEAHLPLFGRENTPFVEQEVGLFRAEPEVAQSLPSTPSSSPSLLCTSAAARLAMETFSVEQMDAVRYKTLSGLMGESRVALAQQAREIFDFFLLYGPIMGGTPYIKKPRKTNIPMTIHVAAILMYQFLVGDRRRPHTMKKGGAGGHIGTMCTEATRHFYEPLIFFFVENVLRGPVEAEIQRRGNLMFDDDVRNAFDFADKLRDKNLYKWVNRQQAKKNKHGVWDVRDVTTEKDAVLGLYGPHYETLKLCLPKFE